MAKGLAVCLCCLLFAFSGCAPVDSGAYDRGMTAFAAGDYDAAMKAFTEAEKNDGRKAEGYRGQGLVYYRRGDYKYAARLFSLSLEAMEFENEEFARDVRLYLTESLMRNGQYEAAEETCETLLETEESPLVQALYGQVKLMAGKQEEALEWFEKATAGSADYDIYLMIYEACCEGGIPLKGEAWLEKAAALSCTTAEDYVNHGKAWYYLEEYPKAEEALLQAAELGSTEAVPVLGKVYLEQKDTAKARALFLQYRNEGIRMAECSNGLAMCACEEGDYEKALFYIEEGLKSNDPAARESLLFNEIVIYERMNDFLTAKEKMEAFLKEYPLDAAARREYKFLSPRQ